MMAVDYKRFLAENVLNDRKTVTHRSLSRALRVHTHLAKQMLYDFHRTENAKSPHSVNATYVITGIQKEEPGNGKAASTAANGTQGNDGDDDEIMQSSPYISSSMPNQDSTSQAVGKASIILVREEDFDDAKATFQAISSMHIYSLQPNVLPDLNVLTDVSREILAVYGNEDPLTHGVQWGMIQNKNVKRRTGARPPPPAPQKEPVSTKQPKQPAQKGPAPQQKAPEEQKPQEAVSEQPAQPEKSRPQPPPKPTKTAPLKRGKSDILNSFAKAKPKPKETPTTPAASGAESAEPSGTEDVAFGDASEEDESEEPFLEAEKQEDTSARETKKDREEKLKMMMEDDDKEMPDATEPSEETEPAEPAEEEATIDKPAPKQAEPKEQITVVGGRRRGRRQISKRKTVKDDEGYLVTVEEPSWESFSEDEPAPPPKKKPAVSANKGKTGGKPGQGNIMSFFSKK